jgi:predicted nucleic acid-binding protein
MDDALEVMRAAETQLRNNEYSVTSANVLQLVEKRNCSAYDCEFVALAHDFGVPLVTMDKKILKNFPETAMSLSDFLKK